jgi:hypothetical protein
MRMDPHDFGLLDPHPESAFQMRIPDADADYVKISVENLFTYMIINIM